jgi:DeoR family glycerol-3-phosphate regulon repressor
MTGRKTGIKLIARKDAIYEFVDLRGEATVDELAEKFNTSLETIRRDLSALAEAGRVRKVHGGVRRMVSSEEGLFDERLTDNRLAKQQVAKKLARVIFPNQSIFIDTGSTTLLCAEALFSIRNLTVITNSTLIADKFSGPSNSSNVILLGGSYRQHNAQTVGTLALEQISHFRTDHAILTVGAIDQKCATDFSAEEAEVARAMIEAAESVTIVADSSKFDRRTTFKVCGLDQIDRLVVEKEPDAKLRNALDASKVEVI